MKDRRRVFALPCEEKAEVERFLTVEEAVRALQVNADTVRRWLRTGKLRGVRFGRLYRIPESALQEGTRGTGGTAVTSPGPNVTHPPGAPGSDPTEAADRGQYVTDDEAYRRQAARVMALIDQPSPLIQAGTLQPIDVTAEIDLLREERTREVGGDPPGNS
jgi:excisionase family DNA binding protein